MHGLLATPTVELVKAKICEFDGDPSTRLGEDALGQLWAQFPRNTETPHVLLKVLALNNLYRTRVRDIDVETLARHIAGLGIDPLLAEGSASAVDLISHCDKLRDCVSFATKYCSWHNPDAYPIYDSRVNECLWSYKKQDGFAKFHRPTEIAGCLPPLRQTCAPGAAVAQCGRSHPAPASNPGLPQPRTAAHLWDYRWPWHAGGKHLPPKVAAQR